jgi:hypothetical protein
MSTNQVPSNIAEIIEQKRAAVKEAQRHKEEAERLEAEALTAKGKAIYEEFIQQALSEVPDFMRPYYVTPSPADEPDYGRLANGWDDLRYTQLLFSVPGLSKIKLSSRDKTWKCEYAYESKQYWDGEEHIWTEPAINFPRDHGWDKDLEYTLALAHKQMVEYQRFVEEYEAGEKERAEQWKKEQEKRQEEKARMEANFAAGQREKQAAEQAERDEANALFDAIKDDPIAVHMLKAFVFLRDERSTFEQRLEQADEAIYSIENRWSNRAAELRRQADEADRRAEDERRRLQDDLDDAEKKLKKAERGW